MTAEPLQIVMPDAAILRGVLWRGGDDSVLLVHDAGQDLDAWRPLTAAVAAAGYTVMTVDLRGHGASDGEWDWASLDRDLAAIVRRARDSVRGRLVMIGAGATGLPVLAGDFDPRPDAVILFSPGPLRNGEAGRLRGERMNKLFVVGAQDRAADSAALALRNHSIGTAAIISFPTKARGTEILSEAWQSQAVEKILAFLAEIRSVSQEAGA